MRRLTTAIATAALLGATLVVFSAAPAHANANITATSVGLTAGIGCDDAELDLGMTNVVTTSDVEGMTTDLAGNTLDSFSQPEDWTGFEGVYVGWGIGVGSPQPDGTIIGAYGVLGQAVPTAENSVEYFVLYRCHDLPAANEVLYSCFGDYGTCPSTAQEAAEALFAASVDDTTPNPGQKVTVSGEGCFYPLAGAVLLNGATGLGGDSVVPNDDGTFTVELTVPADTPAGTALTARVDCGYDGETVLSVNLDLTVAGATPTTATPTTAPPAAAATPRFTG